MKLFHVAKDGGKESTVTGYWLIESKHFFSICLLKFDGPSREAYHTHAFDAISWVLKGWLREDRLDTKTIKHFFPSLKPIWTPKDCWHKVDSKDGISWVLSFRGPWRTTWSEYLPTENKIVTLTNGRKVVNERL